MCYIDAVGGGISIGDNVSIAHGVSVIAFNHKYEDADIPIKDQGIIGKPVVICDDVWIGAKATILCGITIASGCVIGANAVVTKNTEENTVVAGNPARIIKSRLPIEKENSMQDLSQTQTMS